MATSPSVNNYYIGKGIVSFKKAGDSAFRDLGNVPVFEFTPSIDKLDHFSSRSGVKKKDRSVAVQKTASVKLTLDEWSAANLALALLGEIDTNTAGQEVIDIFAASSIQGELKFTGTNDVGARFEWHLLSVEFIPGNSVSPISEEWGTLEVTGDVLAVSGSFGTVTKTAEQA